jgi:hypothetical protein
MGSQCEPAGFIVRPLADGVDNGWQVEHALHSRGVAIPVGHEPHSPASRAAPRRCSVAVRPILSNCARQEFLFGLRCARNSVSTSPPGPVPSESNAQFTRHTRSFADPILWRFVAPAVRPAASPAGSAGRGSAVGRRRRGRRRS